MTEVHIIARGKVGSGKSAILGEIEIALKAIGVPVRYAKPHDAQAEKNITHADWDSAINLYKPEVILHEEIERGVHP